MQVALTNFSTAKTLKYGYEKGLRSALWSGATGADDGVYLEHYLKLGLYDLILEEKEEPYAWNAHNFRNWKTFDDQTFETQHVKLQCTISILI